MAGDIDERKLYRRAIGIEEARRLMVPSEAKIPKSSRRSSSGGHCGNCGQDTMEGHEDGHGMWHYRCPYCVSRQTPDPNPCPRCRCTAHETICCVIPVDSRFGKRLGEFSSNPFKPDITIFKCLNCGLEWNTPEYEKYLLTKAVRLVSQESEFAEKGNVK